MNTMNNLNIIVIGELNADLIFQDIPSFPEMGKEKIANNMTLTMGSASAIFACNIARLGLKTGYIGKLGDDIFGKLVLDSMQEAEVDCNGIMEDNSVQTGVTVVMSFPKNKAMLTYLGAMESFSIRNVDFDYLNTAQHMHLCSYYLQTSIRAGCPELFQKAKEAGLTTSFDPGWDPSEKWDDDILEVLNYVDILFSNGREALNISKQDTIEKALHKLKKYVPVVVITQGREGAICGYEDQKTIHLKAYPINPIDMTGAGDSFNAGFLFQWLKGADIKTCLKYGNGCGAIACTKLGGSTASPSLDELEAFLEDNTENICTDE